LSKKMEKKKRCSKNTTMRINRHRVFSPSTKQPNKLSASGNSQIVDRKGKRGGKKKLKRTSLTSRKRCATKRMG